MNQNHTGSSMQDIGRLWDRYVQVSRIYEQACRTTDAAQYAYELAHDTHSPCESAYAVVEAAFAHEVTWGKALVTASQAFQTASDAAFLTEIGISTR